VAKNDQIRRCSVGILKGVLMSFSLSSPQDIYMAVLTEIEKLINSFRDYSNDAEIKEAQIEALEQLNMLQKDIEVSLNQLQVNSEWDVFTLAFYGETNAGKSTLIEALRILLKEPEKVKEREDFTKVFVQYSGLQKEIETYRYSINLIDSEYNNKFAGIENLLLEVTDKLKTVDNQIKSIQGEIKELEGIVTREKSASFVKFLKYVFGKLSEQKRLTEARNILLVMESEKDGFLKQQDSINQEKERLNQEFEGKTKKLKAELARLQEEVKSYTEKLITTADGKIIGDGRSDFTRTVTSYDFEVNDQKFTFLDLPGIEGNEGLVLDAINSAVQKAHAVFYVISQPKPPQTGDKNSEGTLDKIKNHLGQQTEVYAVFNKRVKNPNSLKDTLIDSDESESLKVLDKIMQSHLGEQYRESISISAYPAFLAAGNCWGDNYLPKKEKFLERFNTVEAILDKSRVKAFGERITGDIVKNSKAKIKKSNFRKTAVVLVNTTEKISKLYQGFLEFQKKLIETKNSTDKKLDDTLEDLKGNLDRDAHSAIEMFKKNVRKKIYDDINSDIDDNEFKIAFEKRLKEGVEKLRSRLDKSLKDQFNKFQEDVSDVIKKYRDYASELLNVYVGSEEFPEFNLNVIDLKNGINKNVFGLAVAVVSSTAGTILLLLTGTGEIAAIVAIVLGAIGSIISVTKAVTDFCDHNYRKSQQRKKADKVLEKSGKEIYKSIKENIAKRAELLKADIESKKNALIKTVDHVKEINRILEKTISKFKTMSRVIVSEGGR
jgi:GTP-binding protein EngB required for normal cell division